MYINNNLPIQHGGFVLQLFLLLLIICLFMCSSCACCNWPFDLDTFLGGTFKSLKFRPFDNLANLFNFKI
jgi:hypothetical protein